MKVMLLIPILLLAGCWTLPENVSLAYDRPDECAIQTTGACRRFDRSATITVKPFPKY